MTRWWEHESASYADQPGATPGAATMRDVFECALFLLGVLVFVAVALTGCSSSAQRAAASEVKVQSHALDLERCRERAIALDAGPRERWWEYSTCADKVDAAYGVPR